MSAPPNERSRPAASGAAFPESFGGDTHSLPSTADNPWCHTDEHGLPDARCWSAMLDQHRRGYLAGYADGLRRIEDEIRTAAAQVVNNAAADIGVPAARRRAGWGR